MLPTHNLPPKQAVLASQVVDSLSSIPNLAALALGGSFASGRATAASDLDFGLYYRESAPFEIERIEKAAKRISAGGAPVVTDFYRWGPWVNGGAWIETASGKVDLLYRNLDQVERTIEDAAQGRIEHHYGQQPPYGFYSVIYLAETRIAIALRDPQGELERLKQRVVEYPAALKARIVDDSLWNAEFTLKAAEGSARAADLYATAGCLTRAFASLTQAIFALNEEYFLTDKRLGPLLRSFGKIPGNYVERMERILAKPGSDSVELSESVRSLRGLWSEVAALCEGSYRSHYTL